MRDTDAKLLLWQIIMVISKVINIFMIIMIIVSKVSNIFIKIIIIIMNILIIMIIVIILIIILIMVILINDDSSWIKIANCVRHSLTGAKLLPWQIPKVRSAGDAPPPPSHHHHH